MDDNTVYDLHKLAKVDEPMYGPIDDKNHSMQYFVNVCGQVNPKFTCFSITKVQILTLTHLPDTHERHVLGARWGGTQFTCVTLVQKYKY